MKIVLQLNSDSPVGLPLLIRSAEITSSHEIGLHVFYFVFLKQSDFPGSKTVVGESAVRGVSVRICGVRARGAARGGRREKRGVGWELHGRRGGIWSWGVRDTNLASA